MHSFFLWSGWMSNIGHKLAVQRFSLDMNDIYVQRNPLDVKFMSNVFEVSETQKIDFWKYVFRPFGDHFDIFSEFSQNENVFGRKQNEKQNFGFSNTSLKRKCAKLDVQRWTWILESMSNVFGILSMSNIGHKHVKRKSYEAEAPVWFPRSAWTVDCDACWINYGFQI